ncbi:YfcC family protein [Tindallia californiensis]|uniref:Uncharacterized membrane protein YfcC, ion transporter superfamily n=1 Tax=Tindallia californiensis TaxID=159292 RepID=A0A1H3R4M7_9FIRM|nr:YfcC family protein [Tindallia californiensis]SDZ20610.1 Uncharacterized membrane protein YfcC, ion transporter superfamily [Tindallia californiensis]
MTAKEKTHKKFQVPHTYTLIMIFVIFAALSTYIIPAGEYTMTEDETLGITLIDPDSFAFVEKNPVGLFTFLTSIHQGMVNGANVIFLVFLVGGFFQVINDTGALDAGIRAAIEKLQGKELMVIPFIMLIMAILGMLGIVINAVIAFIPIGVVLAKRLKLDPLVGMAIMYLGAYSGFAMTPMGPFNTAIAQEIAGVPIFSGFGYRTTVMVVVFIATVIYVMHYAKKIRVNPEKSILGQVDFEVSQTAEDIHFNFSHAIILTTLAIGFAGYAYGSTSLGWGLDYLSGIMLGVALITGVVAKIHPDEMAKSFIKGAQSMVFGALVIGFASSITILLTDGRIIHTIIHGMSIPLGAVGPIFSSIGMFLANLLFNFFVPSGSGQAYVVMPLLSPMADVVGVSRQVAVSAFQYGDGISNIIIPTSGVLMGAIGVAKIPYEKWLKFVMPIFGIWTGIAVLSIGFATLIGWS